MKKKKTPRKTQKNNRLKNNKYQNVNGRWAQFLNLACQGGGGFPPISYDTAYNMESLIIKFTNKCICFYSLYKVRRAWNTGQLLKGGVVETF